MFVLFIRGKCFSGLVPGLVHPGIRDWSAHGGAGHRPRHSPSAWYFPASSNNAASLWSDCTPDSAGPPRRPLLSPHNRVRRRWSAQSSPGKRGKQNRCAPAVRERGTWISVCWSGENPSLDFSQTDKRHCERRCVSTCWWRGRGRPTSGHRPRRCRSRGAAGGSRWSARASPSPGRCHRVCKTPGHSPPRPLAYSQIPGGKRKRLWSRCT